MSKVDSAEKPDFRDVMIAKGQADVIRFEGKE
jgi:hypothetical protein